MDAGYLAYRRAVRARLLHCATRHAITLAPAAFDDAICNGWRALTDRERAAYELEAVAARASAFT